LMKKQIGAKLFTKTDADAKIWKILYHFHFLFNIYQLST